MSVPEAVVICVALLVFGSAVVVGLLQPRARSLTSQILEAGYKGPLWVSRPKPQSVEVREDNLQEPEGSSGEALGDPGGLDTFDGLLNAVARDLPERWAVDIYVQRFSLGATLERPDGTARSVALTAEPLSLSVLRAVREAREQARKDTGIC